MKRIVKKQDLKKIAEDLILEISKINEKQKGGGATIITLSGDLGVGKTTFTQELAMVLGLKKNIVSPTFVIMKNYPIKFKTFKKLIHIDAYRLEKGEELGVIGWDEIVKIKDNLILLEWPEKVSNNLKNVSCEIFIEHKDDETRFFEICYNKDNVKNKKTK